MPGRLDADGNTVAGGDADRGAHVVGVRGLDHGVGTVDDASLETGWCGPGGDPAAHRGGEIGVQRPGRGTDEGGFSRAAERLRVAQPGVSAQVRKLERELGQTLFDRSGPGVRPTDVGVAGEPPAGLLHDTVVEETLVVAVRPDDPFARRASIPVPVLRRRALVAPPPGNALRDALELLLSGHAEEGPVRIVFEVADPATLARLVARGVGVAVLPASVGALPDGTLVGVPPAEPRVPTALALVRRADASPAADALARAMMHALTGTGHPDPARI